MVTVNVKVERLWKSFDVQNGIPNSYLLYIGEDISIKNWSRNQTSIDRGLTQESNEFNQMKWILQERVIMKDDDGIERKL